MENTKTNNSRAGIMAVIMGTLSMVGCFMVWSCLSPLAAHIAHAFNLTISERTLLLATPVLLGSILRIPVGILSDRFGGKKVYIILMLLLLIPVYMVPRVHSYGVLLFLAFLIGISGTSFAVGIAYSTVWFPPERQGLILGLTGLGNLGSAVAALTLPRIMKHYSFTTVFDVLDIILVVLIVLFFFCKEMPIDKNKTLKQALSVTKDPNTWYLSVFYFLTFGLFVTLTTIVPTILGGLFKMDAVTAGLWAATVSALCTLIRPFGGQAADKIRPVKLLKWTFIGIAIFIVGICFSEHSEVAMLTCLIITGLIAGAGNGIVFKMVPYVSKGNTGSVTGFVGAAGGLGGYFPPIILGFVKQHTGSYALGFALIALLAIVCLLLLWHKYIKGNTKLVND